MKTVLIIIGIIGAVIILVVIGILLWLWITVERSGRKKGPSKWEEYILTHPLPQAKRYYGEEHEWNPSFNLHHRGVTVHDIPFVPDKKEVFYLENDYNEEANKFIRENINYIRELFAKKGLRFTYLPDKKLDISKLEIYAKYLYPNLKTKPDGNFDEGTIVFKNGTISLKSSFLLDYMVRPENRRNVKSSFAWFGSEKTDSRTEETIYTFDYITFDATEANGHPKEILDEIFPEVGESKIFGGGAFMIVHDYEGEEEQRTRPYKGGSEDSHSSLGATPEDFRETRHSSASRPLMNQRPGAGRLFGKMIAPEDDDRQDLNPVILDKTSGINLSKANRNLADEHFGDIEALDDETRQTLLDIQHKLESVRLSGISEAIIAKFIKPLPTLSMIVVTYDFHIILPDYGNMEIVMEPLVKAVYILFLRHPEGIMFKNLYDYREELEIIYRCVRSKKNQIDRLLDSPSSPQISKSVDSLCNPTKNSINEKCTRIKEAFILKFSDYLAQNYYITGSKATVKKISLPRSYVYWEKDDTYNTETDMAKI